MSYLDKYNQWLNNKDLDTKLRKELESMNDLEKEDAFYTNVEFGTAGMRGLLGAGTNRLNIYTIRKANVGFAKYLLDLGDQVKEKGVAIAYDNRHMSYEFALESARVLATFGIKSYVFEGLRPTPELSFAVRHLKCAGGIVITASHNPKEYNGYKIYDDTGCQLIPEWAAKVVNYVEEITDELSIPVISEEEAKSFITFIGEDIDEPYYEAVSSIQLNPDLDKSNLTFIFSPQHGTANIPVREVMTRLHYNIVPVLSQCDPNPDFAFTKTPNPEEAGAYEVGIEEAKKIDADLVVICDPDADRLGIAVKHDGEYVLMTGNQTGAVLLEYVLGQRKEKGILPSNAIIFNTVVTSDIGEIIASSYGVETEKTLTGFKFIGDKIRKYEQTGEKQFVFGYEESYGYVIKEFVRDKDAVQAVLMIAEAACFYKHQGLDLYQVLLNLYAKHGTFLESQRSISLKGVEGARRIKEILDNLRNDVPTTFGPYKVIASEDYETSTRDENGKKTPINLPKSNVLKYFLDDGSWVAVRPSGTEPKCKFYYCIKGKDSADVKEKTNTIDTAMMAIIEA